MAKIFISHADVDASRAEIIESWLSRVGHQVFLARSLLTGVEIGSDWEKRLYERLRWSDAVVCVVTPDFNRSPWCAAEIGAARARGNLLLPIQFGGATTHPLLASVQHIVVDGCVDEVFARLGGAFRRLNLAGIERGWDDSQPPFPGLRAFNVKESSIFFGREAETHDLAGMLRSAAANGTNPIVVVVTSSGSGKSSLIRAGLLPAISVEPGWWAAPVMTPTARPVAILADRLSRCAAGVDLRWTPSYVERKLAVGAVSDVVSEILSAAPGNPHSLVVVVDQLEELFVLAGDGVREGFLEVLRSAVGTALQVVATIRPEYLNDAMEDDRGIVSMRSTPTRSS